jgi:hypothetical protein
MQDIGNHKYDVAELEPEVTNVMHSICNIKKERLRNLWIEMTIIKILQQSI